MIKHGAKPVAAATPREWQKVAVAQREKRNIVGKFGMETPWNRKAG